jgi:transposase InsO family protein
VLRTNNNGEFTTAEFTSYCTDEVVQRQYSALYSPQQNGVVERCNQTFKGMDFGQSPHETAIYRWGN